MTSKQRAALKILKRFCVSLRMDVPMKQMVKQAKRAG